MPLPDKTVANLARATDLRGRSDRLARQSDKLIGDELEKAWDDRALLAAMVELTPWCVQKAFAIVRLTELDPAVIRQREEEERDNCLRVKTRRRV